MIVSRAVVAASLLAVVGACNDAEPSLEFIAVTFNSGTTTGMGHDDPPDDGYTSDNATTSDLWYGDGLAWTAVIDSARVFFAGVDADVIVFQEIFHPEECADIPTDQHDGFVCQSWMPGDPTVVQMVVGSGAAQHQELELRTIVGSAWGREVCVSRDYSAMVPFTVR